VGDSTPANRAQMRFYAELNDLLARERRGRAFVYRFWGRPSVKDAIEALGVPHTEVDLILVNGASVGFDQRLRDGDRVAVYPVFEGLDISPLIRLRPAPLRRTAFVLDVHLGSLARLLRMLGLDALYRDDYDDDEIVDLSLREGRIILTRDRGLLKRGAVTHGCWVRAMDPVQQARQVVRRLDLRAQVRPFTRCMRCNGDIERVDADVVRAQLPPQTAAWQDTFCRCADCGQVYWQGTHHDSMQDTVARILS
jgi:uncharacterized protein with PIN domain